MSDEKLTLEEIALERIIAMGERLGLRLVLPSGNVVDFDALRSFSVVEHIKEEG